MRLVLQSVPESAGPFGPSTLINLFSISSTADHCGKWIFVIEWIDMPQPECLLCAFQSAFLSRPPRNQLKYGGQIGVDCVPLPASLTLVPGVLNPQQVLPQCLGGIGHVVMDWLFQSG